MTFSRTPRRPHLVLPGSGLSDEIYFLRQEIADAFIASGGSGELIFADFGTQDEAQGRYTSWTDLMAKLATIQFGASPVVRLALTTGPFTVPLAGMPVNGWDLRGGSFTSFYGASGSVVLDCPPGVMFDNLFGIGGASLGEGSVLLKIAPPAGTQVLNFSALPLGAAYIFVIGGGSAIDHSTDVGAFMKGPDASTTMVLVSAGSQQNTGLLPPLSGPLLEIGATDGAVGGQLLFGGLPDGWLVGGGLGSTLLNIYDINANTATNDIASWCPGFTGGGGVIPFTFGKSLLLSYDDAAVPPAIGVADVQAALDFFKVVTQGTGAQVLYDASFGGNPGDWTGAPPPSLGAAIDRLAAAVAGLLGGTIP